MESLVVTVIGKDRPGLVESVSAVVEEHGGSWVESRMSRLAGEFAGILRVSVPADRADGLTEALEGLRSDGLRVMRRSKRGTSSYSSSSGATVLGSFTKSPRRSPRVASTSTS